MSNERERNGELDEHKVEHIEGRDFAGTSYAANEKEQTRDLRNKDPVGEADVSMGGVSADLENKFDVDP